MKKDQMKKNTTTTTTTITTTTTTTSRSEGNPNPPIYQHKPRPTFWPTTFALMDELSFTC